jgi:hypothetical protein
MGMQLGGYLLFIAFLNLATEAVLSQSGQSSLGEPPSALPEVGEFCRNATGRNACRYSPTWLSAQKQCCSPRGDNRLADHYSQSPSHSYNPRQREGKCVRKAR